MSFLELRKVTKCYGEGDAEVLAVRDVDLSVEAGELVAVMGAERVGQEFIAQHRRDPGGPHERRGHRGRGARFDHVPQ